MNCPWEAAIKKSVDLSADESVAYLTKLTEILQERVNSAPTEPVPFPPPPLPNNNRNRNQRQDRNNQTPRGNVRQNNNRFQLAGLDDDEVEEAQDLLANLQLQGAARGGGSHWSAEDIFIQAVTALGEMLLRQGIEWVKEHRWTESAEQFTHSVTLLNLALQYADMMYARVAARAELNDHEIEIITERVRNNCEAVSIAAENGIRKKEEFEREAHNRQRQLERKLNPQWQDRDEAKQRMGNDAWVSNPNPKGDYAKRRAADEKELRELLAARAAVGEADFSAVRDRSEALRSVA